jgi:hypothetical protein
VEVVGGSAFGALPARYRDAAVATTASLGLHWAAFLFDGRHRLLTVTTATAPGPEATEALGALLRRSA